MFDPRKLVLIAATSFIVVFIVLIASVGRHYPTQRMEPLKTVSRPTIQAVTPPSPTKAFIKLGDTLPSAERGSNWHISMESNTWSQCLADVYQPDGNIRQFKTVTEAKAQSTTVGMFEWTWHVPKDAPAGAWTIRILCGTYQNLATLDRAVEVR